RAVALAAVRRDGKRRGLAAAASCLTREAGQFERGVDGPLRPRAVRQLRCTAKRRACRVSQPLAGTAARQTRAHAQGPAPAPCARATARARQTLGARRLAWRR